MRQIRAIEDEGEHIFTIIRGENTVGCTVRRTDAGLLNVMSSDGWRFGQWLGNCYGRGRN